MDFDIIETEDIVLSEYLTDFNIFDEIGAVEIFPFLYSAGDPPIYNADNDILNMILKMEYGKKIVYPEWIGITPNNVAKIIVKKLRNKWENYMEIELLRGNLNDTRIKETVIAGTENRTGTKQDTNSVTAYNSVNMIANDGSETASLDDLITSKTDTTTDTKINARSTYEMLTIISQDDIITKVITDIGKILTLNIYN